MDKSKTAEKPREFFKVNIHEERTAAYVARSMPFLVFLVTVCVLTLGVLRNTVLLLTVTAALNVAMWLWVVSMGITCIYGVYRAQETIEHAEKAKMQEKPGPKSDAAQDPEKIDKEPEPEEASPKKAPVSHVVEEKVRHIVVIPNYKEPENLLDDTLKSLSEVTGSKDLWVILAMEAREKEAEAKAKNLEEKYTCFAKIMSHFHPENLEEIHLDGSREAEVKGKASNLKSAVKKVCEEVDKETTDEEKGSKTVQLTSRPTDVLTVIDADVILHPMYFAHISREFVAMKENGDDPSYTFWQAPQLPWRNFYTCPVVSRVWGYISSLWEFGGVAGLMYGSHHMVFSAYTVPLELAREAECWDGDVIAEDHHAFLKAWFYAVFLAVQKEGTACSRVQVRPVMLPSKSTLVSSDDGYWSSWAERWDQAKRHAQGVAELSYALLAAWDMLSSLPVTSLGPTFLWRLLKIVFKPFMMHIVSTLQAISLLVLTLYWLANHNQIPWCPDHIVLTDMGRAGDTLLCGLAGAWVLAWPVVIPFMLLIASNFVMIRICFLLPGERPQESSWHRADGDVAGWESRFLGPLFGSKQFATLCLLLFDVVICFGPIMAVYGVLVELVAYCNVLLKGNRFEYKTASKSLANSVAASCDSYGATNSAQETSCDPS